MSPTYWPWIWPSPEPVTLTLATGGESTLELPAVPLGWDDPPGFEPPESAPPLTYEATRPGITSRVVTRDVQSGHAELRFLWDSGGEYTLPGGMRVLFENEAAYSIVEGDPLSARVFVTMAIDYSRDADGWSTRVEARGEMHCDAGRFILDSALQAFESGRPVHDRTWHHVFPRELG
jgi:hypothetical protein